MQRSTLAIFDRFQDAETQTTRARARTAKQFEEFMKPDNLRLFPNLRWVGTTSVNPRQSHAKFAGKVWAKTDNFWKLHSPGTEWNCKCDIEETSDPVTDNSKLKIPQTPPALEGNPFETGEIFSEKASYIRAYNRSRHTREEAEKSSKKIERRKLQHDVLNYPLLSQTCKAEINGIEKEISFQKIGLQEYVQSMFGDKNYWLKNEILPNMSKYIEDAQYVRSSPVDLTHNSGKKLKFKKKLVMFHYLQGTLPNGDKFCLHIAEYKKGQMILYTATKNVP